MLARDAFHAAAAELVPDWDRDKPNRLSLHLQVLKATGLQPEAFNNLMQMDEIRVIREAAKMKREEREALVAGLRSCTTAPAGERRSVAMSLEQFGAALILDPRVFKERAARARGLARDGTPRWAGRPGSVASRSGL